jgi:hypothetical protein
MEGDQVRPTISDPSKKIARRDVTPRRARIQFDDGGNIAVSAFDRNDFAAAIYKPNRLDDGRIQQHASAV